MDAQLAPACECAEPNPSANGAGASMHGFEARCRGDQNASREFF